ncbi:MAG: beta-glucosidase BglX [Bacteroidaceae bacterium]|nr:beta-glucosidase BglX [Bacteroidaceae bacterium]
MRHLLISLSLLFYAGTISAQTKNTSEDILQKTDPVAMNAFIDNLMSRMTLEEKLGQLNQHPGGQIVTGAPLESPTGKLIAEGKLGSVFNVKGVDEIHAMQKVAVEKSRLGIPLLVAMDVIHGFETMFPVPLGVACTWDMDAIYESARIAAEESAANGVAWTFSPMVDIALDSRWGRQAESAGEDPYLGSKVAEAMVRGYQTRIMACVKHFALYGGAEAGLDYQTVDMSRQRMYNQYFPPYKAAVDAGVGSVMSSFNIVDGIPATANRWLLDDVLRRQWGFKGLLVTDYASIAEMSIHGLGQLKENSIRALLAGTDMDMCANGFIGTLEQSLKEGRVTQADIDRACRNVLEAKYKLGLFDDPYRFGDKKKAKAITYCKAHKDAARRITAESFVLLKNDAVNGKALLPLKKQGTIALIGPLVDTRTDIAGTWSTVQAPEKYKTLREGFQDALKGKATLLCSQGCNLLDNRKTQEMVARGHGNEPIPFVDADAALSEAVAVAKQADVIVCAMGECAWMSGEGTSRSILELYPPQRRLLEALTALGKPIVLLNFAGRATALQWEDEHLPAIMNVWFGSECADALCDVLFGEVSPSGRLTVSMPRVTGQEPLYYNHLPSGRPVADGTKDYSVFTGNYIDVAQGALYPFGYGLTYSQFTYSAPRLSATKMTTNGSVDVSVTVTNTGQREATEVVQLYIHDREASISRPVKELKDFSRITLKPGESKDVVFKITPDKLSFYNYDLQYVLEPGEFDIMTGPDSRNVQSTTLKVE